MQNKEVTNIVKLYHTFTGKEPQTIVPITGTGSNRNYVRLIDEQGKSLIGVEGTNPEENNAFIYLANHFGKQGIAVPQVLCVSDDGMCYLQKDLGKTTLFEVLSHSRSQGGNYTQEEESLLVKVMQELPAIQVRGAQQLDWSQCYPQPALDRTGILFDLNYFKYCFLKSIGIDFDEYRLEKDFNSLATDLLQDEGDYFLYRDFQARNIMIDDKGNLSYIDFQGGRRGPFYYDVASFVWQAAAKYNDKLRQKLVSAYYQALQQHIKVPSREHFDQRLQLFVFFRTLQVLGAYGFRGYVERKQHFIESIPPALQNLQDLLQDNCLLPYSYLKDTLQRMIEHHSSNNQCRFTPSSDSLVVDIYSFSYRKGIPEDLSGNGGGYVFDCRSTHNPGRYDPYKQLTGLDKEVIKFLEDDGEIITFLQSVYSLADTHVQRYIERGFTHLQFAFGCTGGQHRSVYAAQHLAEHLHQKFGLEIHLCHREQGIEQHFMPREG